MKTAGELLKEKRLLKELSFDDVAKKTKIKIEYLEAIETSNYGSLPSSTFAKGFLRNYANFLHLNPDTMVAMFRRDFTQNSKGEIIPRGLVEPVGSKTRFFSVSLILTTIAIIVFIGFLGIQLISWWSLPKIKLIQPQNNDTYGEKVTFKGVADNDTTVKVNGQLVILDQNGQFTLDLIFPAGTHSVIVESTNRRGKSTLVERTFSVSK
ncbi:MAG: helix-turn-helix domain-containing protein [Microgenomates group bacterium]